MILAKRPRSDTDSEKDDSVNKLLTAAALSPRGVLLVWHREFGAVYFPDFSMWTSGICCRRNLIYIKLKPTSRAHLVIARWSGNQRRLGWGSAGSFSIRRGAPLSRRVFARRPREGRGKRFIQGSTEGLNCFTRLIAHFSKCEWALFVQKQKCCVSRIITECQFSVLTRSFIQHRKYVEHGWSPLMSELRSSINRGRPQRGHGASWGCLAREEGESPLVQSASSEDIQRDWIIGWNEPAEWTFFNGLGFHS